MEVLVLHRHHHQWATTVAAEIAAAGTTLEVDSQAGGADLRFGQVFVVVVVVVVVVFGAILLCRFQTPILGRC